MNRDHFATWLVMAMPLPLRLCCRRRSWPSGGQVRSAATVAAMFEALGSRAVWVAVSCAVMALALVISTSRSGLIALTAAAVMAAWAVRGRVGRRAWLLSAIAVALLAVVGSVYVNMQPLLSRVDETIAVGAGGRPRIWKETLVVVRDFWPVGTGLGTYQDAMLVYQEDKRGGFFNQAHNQYLHLLSDGGLLLSVPSSPRSRSSPFFAFAWRAMHRRRNGCESARRPQSLRWRFRASGKQACACRPTACSSPSLRLSQCTGAMPTPDLIQYSAFSIQNFFCFSQVPRAEIQKDSSTGRCIDHKDCRRTIEEVVPELVAAGDIARRVDLGDAGQAGTDAVTLGEAGDILELLVRAVAARLDLARAQRPRPDKTHVADEDAPQLWQLVHRRGAHQSPDPGDARVVLAGLQRSDPGLGVRDHRAELVGVEDASALAHALLTVEDRPAVLELYGRREQGPQRRRREQPGRRGAPRRRRASRPQPAPHAPPTVAHRNAQVVIQRQRRRAHPVSREHVQRALARAAPSACRSSPSATRRSSAPRSEADIAGPHDEASLAVGRSPTALRSARRC